MDPYTSKDHAIGANAGNPGKQHTEEVRQFGKGNHLPQGPNESWADYQTRITGKSS